MFAYRISLKKWSKQLVASGKPARWNSTGNKMIYTATTRSLACLESMVHRHGRGLNKEFKVMVIEIPASIRIENIEADDLPSDWFEYDHYEVCREIGDTWLQKKSSAVLKVPSAIISNEFNFLLNPEHTDFKKIKLKRVEEFRFDPRIKA